MRSVQTNALRQMTRGAYQLQKLRIQTGLRLCANFRQKLKIHEDDSAELDEETGELGDKAKGLLDRLRESYSLLTEGVARHRTLPKREGFVGDPLISDFTELVLVHQYLGLEKQEREQFRLIEETLETIPIYVRWLHGQRGIGPALAAVLITWFDPHKAERPSQFWAFAGLDVAPDGRARGRYKEHLIEREYTDRNGELKTKMSTTFDPWLQSRLLGVLNTSLLRSTSPYRVHYDNRRHRVETDPARAKGTLLEKKNMRKAGRIEEADRLWHPLRIHRDAMRYMVKQFIADFWREWRTIEGLPVVPTYQEAKLGHVHGGRHEPPEPTAEAAE